MARGLGLNPAPLWTFLSIAICRATQHTFPNSSSDTTAIEEESMHQSRLGKRCYAEQSLAPTQGVARVTGNFVPYINFMTFSQTLRTHRCAVLQTDTNQKPTVD